MPRGTHPFLQADSSERSVGTRVLGVDPGVSATGFGVVEVGQDGSLQYCGSGVFRPEPLQALPQRIQYIYQGLCEKIKNFGPQRMAVERPFYAKNVKSAMLLGQVRGVALLAAAEAGIGVEEYSPLEVKQAVSGYGRATKEQVQAMIRSLLNPPHHLPADAADALAVALCLAHSLPWQKSLQGMGWVRSKRRARGSAQLKIFHGRNR